MQPRRSNHEHPCVLRVQHQATHCVESGERLLRAAVPIALHLPADLRYIDGQRIIRHVAQHFLEIFGELDGGCGFPTGERLPQGGAVTRWIPFEIRKHPKDRFFVRPEIL